VCVSIRRTQPCDGEEREGEGCQRARPVAPATGQAYGAFEGRHSSRSPPTVGKDLKGLTCVILQESPSGRGGGEADAALRVDREDSARAIAQRANHLLNVRAARPSRHLEVEPVVPQHGVGRRTGYDHLYSRNVVRRDAK
jgi:hypothetical protein